MDLDDLPLRPIASFLMGALRLLRWLAVDLLPWLLLDVLVLVVLQEILRGDTDAPASMQPLYAALSKLI